MTDYDTAMIIAKLEQEIPMLESVLSHLINRRREIDAYDAPNKAYKRKLLERYRSDIMFNTDVISNKKNELWGLQELELPRA